jgi:hypothetical protein
MTIEASKIGYGAVISHDTAIGATTSKIGYGVIIDALTPEVTSTWVPRAVMVMGG